MPSDIWSVVMLAGLWGWVVFMLLFIFRAFPARGVFESRPALCWGGCAAISFALWIAGLLNA